jgi:hypothetical protein
MIFLTHSLLVRYLIFFLSKSGLVEAESMLTANVYGGMRTSICVTVLTGGNANRKTAKSEAMLS